MLAQPAEQWERIAAETTPTTTLVIEAPNAAEGYRRIQSVDGRIYAEQVDSAASSASYSVIGRGVALRAEGTNLTLDQARSAVDTIGVQRLERQFGN